MEQDESKKRYGEREKRANFKRLAEKRTNTILDKLRVLGNLSSKSLYSYDDPDVDKIFNAIQERITEVRARFSRSRKKHFEL